MKFIKFTKKYLSYEVGTSLKGNDFDRLVNLSKVAVYIDEKEYKKLQDEANKKAFEEAEKLKEASKPKVAKTPCAECGEKAKSLEAVIEEQKKEIESLKSKVSELEKPKAKTPTKTK